MGFGGNIVWFGSGVGIGLDPVVTDWVGRTVAAGGSVSASTQTAVDTYVKGCKTDGYWSILSVGLILPFASDEFAGCFFPLVVPSGRSLTNNNFLATDYSLISGLNPGSTNNTKWIDTNIQCSDLYSQTSAQISAYFRSHISKNSAVMSTNGEPLGNTLTLINTWSNNISYFDSFNSGGGRVAGDIGVNKLGWVSGIRTTFQAGIYRNGTLATVASSTTGGNVPTTNVIIGKRFDNLYLGSIISHLYAGKALTDSQETLHYSRVQALQNDLGRAV